MKREYCMDTKTTVLSKNKTNVVNARQLPVFRAFCKYATLIDEK
jgi:hypothetical protein